MADDTFQSKSDGSIPRAGFWVERDTSFVRITADFNVFGEPYTTDGNTGRIIAALEDRGTMLSFYAFSDGVAIDDDSELHCILGYAAGAFVAGTNTVSNTTPLLEELKAAFTEIASGTIFEISVESKFALTSDEASPLAPIA